jgi:hypothetical protein
VLGRAGTPMTAREIAESLIAGKTAAILVALRRRDGETVAGEGAPARWRLKEAAS